MMTNFRTILIGGEAAKRAAMRIAEFDYLVGNKLSVSSFVNSNTANHFQLISCGNKWWDVPIYDSLVKAVEQDKNVNTVSLHFNAKRVLYWVEEVIKWPQIKNLVILAEDVPERDGRELVRLAKEKKINIVGPSSLGMIVAGQSRVGEIGGDFRNLQLCKLDQRGCVGLITKSGGMSGELMWVISQNSPGVSSVVQIGGDAFPATDFVWWLEKFAQDPEMKWVVLSGEAGGDLEERAAEWLSQNKPHFKTLAVISGKFLEQMPKGQKFGHAGAKQEESGFGSAKHKIEALQQVGVEAVPFEDLGKRLREISMFS